MNHEVFGPSYFDSSNGSPPITIIPRFDSYDNGPHSKKQTALEAHYLAINNIDNELDEIRNYPETQIGEMQMIADIQAFHDIACQVLERDLHH